LTCLQGKHPPAILMGGGTDVTNILNGAQITSVLNTVQRKKDGLITVDQARAILTSGLGLTDEQARAMIGA